MGTRLWATLCLGAAISVPGMAQDSNATQGSPASTGASYGGSQTGVSLSDGSPQQNGNTTTSTEQMPIYRVTVIARSTAAVNYRNRGGSTKVDFKGTALMPEANGSAKVTGRVGKLDIETAFEHMKDASSFGPQYLTFVLWAITPEGRPVNLGEVVPHKGKLQLNVTTGLQSFGLIVTAEPYFGVTRPSNLVVLENIVRKDTKGWEQPIMAKYEALDRGEYSVDIDPSKLPATGADRKKVPLDLLEARNAVAIAEATGAQQYAPDALARAKDFLNRGEDYLNRKQGSKAIGTVTRGAVQSAEDARLLTIRRMHDEKLASDRRAAQQREEEARRQAEEESQRAQASQQQAEQAHKDREAAEAARQQAEAAAQRATQERQAAILQQQALAARAQQAEQEREQMRARLTQQLNQVLQTQDTARGLIVNMSDVLFDFNKATLRSGAKLRLAKVAGIILSYPDLKLQIEGFTDNIGTPQYNQELSEKRAAAVRDFLISQGVNMNNIAAQGYGATNFVAENNTAQGRQMNRRVDLVVNGESIQAARFSTPGNASGTTGGSAGAAQGSSPSPGATGGSGSAVGAPSSNPHPADNNQMVPPASTQPTTPQQ